MKKTHAARPRKGEVNRESATFRLPPDMLQWLKEEAKRRGISQADILVELWQVCPSDITDPLDSCEICGQQIGELSALCDDHKP